MSVMVSGLSVGTLAAAHNALRYHAVFHHFHCSAHVGLVIFGNSFKFVQRDELA
jgi:hypothetical protein